MILYSFLFSFCRCGHCKTLAPTLDKVANFIQGKMAIGKIDCTKQTKICKRFEVKGYPTLKVYRDGVFMDYPGERHADAFITFGERLSKNAISLIQNSQEAFDLLLSKSTIAFVAYDPKATIAETGSTLEDILQSTSALQVFNQIARKQQVFASFGLLSPTITKEQFLEFGFGKKYKEEVSSLFNCFGCCTNFTVLFDFCIVLIFARTVSCNRPSLRKLKRTWNLLSTMVKCQALNF